LARDYRTADLSQQDRAMLDYAVKLTACPRAVDVRDVDALRAVGFDDTGILDICQVVSYYNYVNRLADGLGVELEDFWTDEDLTLAREEFERIVSSKNEGGAVE
jgi:uncharacterized peroxidase-related enzyme